MPVFCSIHEAFYQPLAAWSSSTLVFLVFFLLLQEVIISFSTTQTTQTTLTTQTTQTTQTLHFKHLKQI